MIKDPIRFISDNKIVAIVRYQSKAEAISCAYAAMEAGFKLFEISMVVPKAIDAIVELKKNRGIMVGAGTITDEALAQRALDAGVDYVASGILDSKIIECTRKRKALVMAGAFTPNEVLAAHRQGVDLVRIFPVSSVDGPTHVEAIRNHLPFVRLMPTGGVDLGNVVDYFLAGSLAVGVSGALFEEELVQKRAWDRITRVARSFLKRVEEIPTA